MDFFDLENKDGIRFTWNNFPSSKVSATKNVIPVCALYSPYKDLENLALVEYDSLRCRCQAVLNPFCQVDFNAKVWICCLCGARNNFPKHYAEYISDQNLPAELVSQYTTIEYISTAKEILPNAFLLLIDTCITQEELEAVKSNIEKQLNNIPPNSFVGLITFGRFVFVHELGFQECPKSYVLNGSKDYTSQQIQDILGISVHHDPRGAAGGGGSHAVFKKFLIPLQDCEFTLNSILDDLQHDPWIVPADERCQRATGTALNTAISLLEVCASMGSRLIAFLGGPCSIGPGQVVDLKLVSTIRSYLDIQKENANCAFIKKSQMYYEALAQRAIKTNQIIDLFIFSLDQIGLMEMKWLPEKSGGYVIQDESFTNDTFSQSFQKLFEKDPNGDLKMGFQAKIELFTTRDVKCQGAVGPCTSLKKASPVVAEQQIGQGGTCQWYLGGIDRCTTMSFFLDLSPSSNQQLKKVQAGKACFLQFQTNYKHSNGKQRLRVTTVQRRFADDANSVQDLAFGFDQQAACVAMARLGVLKSDEEDSLEVLKWLDRSLIRLVSRFSVFTPNQPASFQLQKEFQLFPQFMFHLRRSHFLQVFGISPDEATFYRLLLIRENTDNSLVMIQPALLSYTFDNITAEPVHLDLESLKNNVILLLDTYFKVVIWHGEHIKKWQDMGYQDQPEYENFKNLLQAPHEDVKMILEDRFPAPKVIISNQGDGKERHLKSKVNPSGVNSNQQNTDDYINDDASLKLFMDHLIKFAVQTQN